MVDDSNVRKREGVGKGALKKVNEPVIFGDSRYFFVIIYSSVGIKNYVYEILKRFPLIMKTKST